MIKRSFGSNKGDIVIFQAKSGVVRLDVKLENETVWLTQKQMAILFDKDVKTVNEHIQNVFKERELEREPTIRKFRIVQIEGKRRIERNIDFYNLDVIISVGYRVKSRQGTQFRIWATNILRNYLVQGYVLNQKRLIERETSLKELQETIAFISSKASHPQLTDKTGDLLRLINEYANALTILHEYDSKLLKINRGKAPTYVLTYESAVDIINEVRNRLGEKGEATELFGREVGHKFKGIIGVLYQTFDRKELYVSMEEKAAHILYLVIKDHPFADGNKRVGSLLFVYFLDKNGHLRKANGEPKFNDNTVVALSLLIAASDPREKETMIKIITNLLK